MPITCLEVVSLRLAQGANREAFLSGAAEVDRLLAATPGCLGRTLAETTDGQWIDIVGWRDRSTAEAAASSLSATPAAKTWFTTMEPTSIVMRHLDVQLERWPSGSHLTWSSTGAGTVTGRDSTGAMTLNWLSATAPSAAVVMLQRP